MLHPSDALGRDWVEAFVEGRALRKNSPSGFPEELDFKGVALQNQDADCFRVALAEMRPEDRHRGLSSYRRIVAEGWQTRADSRSHTEILVVGPPSETGDRLVVFGPKPDSPLRNLKREHIKALTELALSQSSRSDAGRVLKHWLPGLEDNPGVLNQGLFDSEKFKAFARDLSAPVANWSESAPLLEQQASTREQEAAFFEGLGCHVVQRGEAYVLHADGEMATTAVFCEADRAIGARSDRFGGQTPLAYALSVAKETGTSWVVVVRGPEAWLYPVSGEAGVGGGGRESTSAAINLSLLGSDRDKYAQMLFSADAFRAGGHLQQLLDSSRAFVADLGNRLRERIYDKTIPLIASAIARRLPEDTHDISDTDLDDAFEQVMLVLFRLLFVAYGEQKGLLPLDDNHHYRQGSLWCVTEDIITEHVIGGKAYDEHSTDYWARVNRLWEAVSSGHQDWGVPAYDGGLFSVEDDVSQAGASLAQIDPLSDAEFGPALEAMLVSSPLDRPSQDDPKAGAVPVDFGSLSVREFGTIYEGLLESRLVVAPSDLKLDRNNSYSPASHEGEADIKKGAVYLSHRSGTRKSTGSYFTKPFAVQHLLDHALLPALDDHIARLDLLHDTEGDKAASDAFLDFRCADIAMGSGHFLVAAIDRIEERLSDWLAEHPLPQISERLSSLREAAHKALGDDIDIPNGSLLRRLVARNCIYGVDSNHVAVELARLAVWVHTFVPGLPLSFLDHSLVHGDSLTGIASVKTAEDAVRERYPHSLENWQALDQIAASYSALGKLADISDETVADVAEARRAHTEAGEAVAAARAAFDLISAERAGVKAAWPEDPAQMVEAAADPSVADIVADLRPMHFPAVFPEVFARQSPGFDCILGNPPFEEATVEELGFWALRFPGLKSKRGKQRGEAIANYRAQRPDLHEQYESDVGKARRLRELLLAGPYPGMGVGDPDLYKAFCWRFWHLLRDGGRIGVVLPRSALSVKGSTQWRKAVLAEGAFEDVTMLLNSRGWVFDDVHPQYTFALCSLRKTPDADTISMNGPFNSREHYDQRRPGAQVKVSEFNSWSKSSAFPLIPSPEALTVFSKMRRHPRLDTRSNPADLALPVSELHATNDKGLLMNDNGAAAARGQPECWPVYGGKAFNLWQHDTGTYFDSANADQLASHLYDKRLRQHTNSRSAFHESRFSQDYVRDQGTLPCRFPRIAFRDITRATDTRTMIAALVPPNVLLTNKAPYLVWPHGTARNEAYLLGVLSSMILDWYARRVVETNMNLYILNGLPIPDTDIGTDPVAQRVIEISGQLAAADARFADWARAVGVPVSSTADAAARADLIHELDACVARLYRLDWDDINVIYDTFHDNTDHNARKTAVLSHFTRLT